MKKRILIFMLIFILIPTQAFANFTIKADPDEHGIMNIEYFSFEDPQHEAWRNSGGYLEVRFIDSYNKQSEYDPVFFRIPGNTQRMYFHYEGKYMIQPFYSDGRTYGWGSFKDFSIGHKCKYDEDYYEGFRRDPYYEGNPFTSPNLDCQSVYDPDPTDPDPTDPDPTDPDPTDPDPTDPDPKTLDDVVNELDKANKSLNDLNNKMDNLQDLINDKSSDLKKSVDNVKNAIDSTNNKLDTANNKLDSLINISNTISSKLDTANYYLRDISDNLNTNMSPPSFTEKKYNIEDYMPKLDTPKFEDNNTYFSDSGHVDDIPSMPLAPEPKHWDGLLPEDNLVPNPELSIDNENEKSQELIIDQENSKDMELIKDQFNIDTELSKDQFNLDNELKKDHFNLDQEFFKSNEMTQNNNFEQHVGDYNLRWKSVDGVFK